MTRGEINYILNRFIQEEYDINFSYTDIFMHKDYKTHRNWAIKELKRFILRCKTNNYILALDDWLNHLVSYSAVYEGNKIHSSSWFFERYENPFYTLTDLVEAFIDYLETVAPTLGRRR